MPLTLNPDICAQPTLQAANCSQTKIPAQHQNFLINKLGLSEAAVGLPPSELEH